MTDIPLFRSFAIVPAAGSSERMGTDKRLLPWRHTTLIEHVLGVWRASRVDCTVVVLQAGDAELAERCRRAGAEAVRPETTPAEMKASVQIGLEYVAAHHGPRPHDVWLVAPADIPGLSAPTIDRLLSAHRPDQPQILVPVHGDATGHPALFPWSDAGRVAELADGVGLRGLFSRRTVIRVECPSAAIARDIDTRDEYMRRHKPPNR